MSLARLRLIDSRCDTKALISGRKPALTKAAHLAKDLGEPIEAYHCVFCHGWHLGHPRGWRAANDRQVRRGPSGPKTPDPTTQQEVRPCDTDS